MIVLAGLTYRYPGRSRPVFAGLELAVERGERLLVAGPSGAGKSSLLRTLNGLVPHFHGGVLGGRVRVDGRDPVALGPRGMSDLVGFVIQDPEAHFVARRVEDEVAFGLECHAVPAATMRRRVGETLERLGVGGLGGRAIATLSGGERQRVAIASVLALEPAVLVLDEPTSQLDPGSADALLATLDALHRDLGTTIVLSEHRLERVLGRVDRALVLGGDEPRLGSPAAVVAGDDLAPPLLRLAHALGWQPPPVDVEAARADPRVAVLAARRRAPAASAQPAVGGPAAGEPAITVRGLEARYPGREGGRPALAEVDLTVPRGSLTALLGTSGAGKSTLLKVLVGLLEPTRGEVRLHGRAGGVTPARARLAATARVVGFVPQNPSRLLFHETVAEELAFSLKAHGRPPAEADRLLADLGLAGLEGFHPRDLSTGERQRLAVATILAGEPEILLLDEPTRGLDAGAKARLAAWLETLRARGMTIVVATHDVELVAASADRAVVLADGRLAAAGPTAEVLAASPIFRPQMLRLFEEPRWLTVEDVLREVRP